MKKFRVIVLMHDYMVPPEDVSGHDLMTMPWKTEHDVIVTLREMEHEVLPLGVGDDLAVVRRTVQQWQPDIVFNMMEAFHELGTATAGGWEWHLEWRRFFREVEVDIVAKLMKDIEAVTVQVNQQELVQ